MSILFCQIWTMEENSPNSIPYQLYQCLTNCVIDKTEQFLCKKCLSFSLEIWKDYILLKLRFISYKSCVRSWLKRVLPGWDLLCDSLTSIIIGEAKVLCVDLRQKIIDCHKAENGNGNIFAQLWISRSSVQSATYKFTPSLVLKKNW